MDEGPQRFEVDGGDEGESVGPPPPTPEDLSSASPSGPSSTTLPFPPPPTDTGAGQSSPPRGAPRLPQGFLPASQVPTPPPLSEPSPPKGRKNTAQIVALVLGGVAVVALIAAGITWFWPILTGDADPAPSAYAHPPTLKATVNVSGGDEPVVLVPLKNPTGDSSGEAIARVNGLTVFGAQVGEENILVAMDSVADGEPVWTEVVGVSPRDCFLTASAVNCGSSGIFNLTTGERTSEGGGTDGGEDFAADPAGDSSAGGEAAQVTARRVPASEDSPYYTSGGSVLDSKDNVIAAFGQEPVWQLADEELDGGTWVFTDGEQIIVVEGGSVTWERKLSAGSAPVNVPNSACSVTMSGSVLLVGEPEGIVALNLEDGKEMWRLEASVDSWLASGDTLLVAGEGDVRLLEFSDESTGGQSGGEESSAQLALDAVNVPEAPAYEDLANALLEFPEGFSDFLNSPDGDYIQLHDGQYRQTGEEKGGFLNLHEVEPLYIGDDAYVVALLDYGLYRSDAFGSIWVIYDSDLELVDSHGLGEAGGFAWLIPYATYDYYNPQLNAWFLPSEEGSFTIECETQVAQGSGNIARVTWAFDGREATFQSLEFDSASGTARQPDQALLQQIRDDLSAGRDDAAAPYLSARALDQVQNGHISEGKTPETMLRGLAFPAGGEVQQCILASSYFDPYEGTKDANGVQIGFPGSGPYWPAVEGLPDTIWYCGLDNGDIPVISGVRVYSDFLVISTDENGTPRIEWLDRIYS